LVYYIFLSCSKSERTVLKVAACQSREGIAALNVTDNSCHMINKQSYAVFKLNIHAGCSVTHIKISEILLIFEYDFVCCRSIKVCNALQSFAAHNPMVHRYDSPVVSRDLTGLRGIIRCSRN
jgi:hypothetical protein